MKKKLEKSDLTFTSSTSDDWGGVEHLKLLILPFCYY